MTADDSDEILERLTCVFRSVGYDGATLSKLSDATGLQRASLYHRFPGGKKEMAEAVLARTDRLFREHIIAPLTTDEPPDARLRNMARSLDAFYAQGTSSCLLGALSIGEGGDLFADHIRSAFTLWVKAFAKLRREATGCGPKEARERAEDAVVRIQGALVLVRGVGDSRSFQRALSQLPAVLLGDD